jgi:hypothetical protein
MYVYIGSTINNVIYSFGSRSVIANIISFSTTIPLGSFTQGAYYLYFSEQDPATMTNPVVNQLICAFNVSNQIVISNIVTSPSPVQTYLSAIYTGTILNWVPNIYPSKLNLFYTTLFDNNLIVTNIAINADGTFSYADVDNTLPGVTISLSDTSVYGTGYVESNLFTINAVIGLINPVLTTSSYAIYDLNTNFNIQLTQWNTSYPANVYVYLSDINNNVIYSFGAFPTSTPDMINYLLTFISTVPVTVTSGSYNLYIADPSL